MTSELASRSTESFYCQQCGGSTTDKMIEGRERPVCDTCDTVTYFDPKVSVAVIVCCEGRLLLGRRAEGAAKSGKWSFPAGFVERGEPVEDAAIREAREEVGIDISLGPLVGVYSEPGEEVVLVVYAVASVNGKVEAGDDMDSAAWFELEHLPELAFPRDLRILRDWQSSVAHENAECALGR